MSSPAVSVFFIFIIFQGSALLPRAPQCPWTWPSTFLDQGCPGLTSVTPGSPGPGSQPQLPDPLLPCSPSAKKLPLSPQATAGAGTALGQSPAHRAHASQGPHPVEAPYRPAHFFTQPHKWPLHPQPQKKITGEVTSMLHAEALLVSAAGFECGPCVAHVCVMLLCVCACARLCFCLSQPLRICLFPFYDHFLSLCKALGWAWRSRNCLQVVLQAWSRPPLSPCSEHNGSSQGQFA